MQSEETKPAFEGWAVVELFGHSTIAGYVTEVSLFGTAFMRVDVPETNGNPGYTKMFGGNAIYGITPTSEEIATQAASRIDFRPVNEWTVPTRVEELRVEVPMLPKRIRKSDKVSFSFGENENDLTTDNDPDWDDWGSNDDGIEDF